MIWACFMLAFWRQKASALAHRWGVLDYEVRWSLLCLYTCMCVADYLFISILRA